MSTNLKPYIRCITTSSHDVEEIVDVLARAREHLSVGRYAITANLIHQAENKLGMLGKERANGQTQ